MLTRVSLCDAPVGREVLDLDAGPLAATYSDATVTVLGVCAYALGTSQASFGSDGGVGAIEVAAGAECAWSVVNETSWIGITPPANGIGNGSVSYTVEPNPLPDSRTAVLRIGGEAVTVKHSTASAESNPPTSANVASQPSQNFAASLSPPSNPPTATPLAASFGKTRAAWI